ncbi:WAS/WASL-interacting protein family member 1-like [Odocoileus virginianus]|uniref:WAS/WASL-interacting protein family member 1-like n=1 Tax=Odocoileus virginianus TaxID=9874 RepID=A0ABM4IPV7_ODOVR
MSLQPESLRKTRRTTEKEQTSLLIFFFGGGGVRGCGGDGKQSGEGPRVTVWRSLQSQAFTPARPGRSPLRRPGGQAPSVCTPPPGIGPARSHSTPRRQGSSSLPPPAPFSPRLARRAGNVEREQRTPRPTAIGSAVPPYPRPGSTDGALGRLPAHSRRAGFLTAQTEIPAPSFWKILTQAPRGPPQPKTSRPSRPASSAAALSEAARHPPLAADATGQPRQSRERGVRAAPAPRPQRAAAAPSCRVLPLWGPAPLPASHPKTPAARSIRQVGVWLHAALPPPVGPAQITWFISEEMKKLISGASTGNRRKRAGIGPTESASMSRRGERPTQEGTRAQPRGVCEAGAHREFAETRLLARSLARWHSRARTASGETAQQPRATALHARPGDTAATAARARRTPLARHHVRRPRLGLRSRQRLPDASG